MKTSYKDKWEQGPRRYFTQTVRDPTTPNAEHQGWRERDGEE